MIDYSLFSCIEKVFEEERKGKQKEVVKMSQQVSVRRKRTGRMKEFLDFDVLFIYTLTLILVSLFIGCFQKVYFQKGASSMKLYVAICSFLESYQKLAVWPGKNSISVKNKDNLLCVINHCMNIMFINTI